MTRTPDVVTPDVVTLASLNTHRLIVTLPNQGPADVRSNLPRATAAAILRRLADELDHPPRTAADAVLDLAAARRARLTRRTQR
ncbi:hypothetical protein ACFWA6_06400 [Streptomyces sp. NPDC060020]|uniref:hypothetical protein n=1 Tax=Streptomyces sp. NPDC060020 TaxID=3347038 RepID=UPI0036972988